MFGFMSGSKSVRGLQASLFAIEASITALKSQNSGTQTQLSNIQTTQEQLMASVAEVLASQNVEDAEIQTLINAAQAGQQALANASAQISQLQATIAAGTGIQASDLDPIKSDMDARSKAIEQALNPPSSGSTGATGATGATGGTAGGTGSDSPVSGNTGP